LPVPGSRFNLFTVADEDVVEIKGDKAGIGYNRYSTDTMFTETDISVAPGHRYILATDGLFDQIGGPKRRGFGKARLGEFIKANKTTKVTEQGDALRATFSAYQGDEYRRDDLTVLGFESSTK
jgi:serine phosphatase RsbU (regulator of sigma subunit)